MTGRIVNVRPKPGYVMDSGGAVVPMGPRAVPVLRDGLYNALTGMGSRSDPRTHSRYTFCPLTPDQIATAYRASWLIRKAIRIPALDAVREWRDWQAEQGEIEKLEEAERKLGIPQKVLQAEVYRGLGGGALILGAPGDPGMPISKQAGTGALAFVQVVSRWKLSGRDWIDDATMEGYGGPTVWEMATTRGQVRLHPSRVVAFRGEPIPDIMGLGSYEDLFWGESKVQALLDVCSDADTARQSFASLVNKARSTIIGIPNLLESTGDAEGEAAFQRRMASFAAAESMFNAIVHDAGEVINGESRGGETIEHRQVNWAGIPEIIRVFAENVAAAADIPMTRFWGKSAEGMNASGDSQQRDWNKMVGARQRLEVQPCVDQLDAVLIPSALGTRPPELWWEWAPLDTPTESEEATRFKTTMEAVTAAQNTGAVPDKAFAEATQNTLVENGWMPGLDSALKKIPEAERYGIEQEAPEDEDGDPSAIQGGGDPDRRRQGVSDNDGGGPNAGLPFADAKKRRGRSPGSAWDPAKHPRGRGGKFTSKGVGRFNRDLASGPPRNAMAIHSATGLSVGHLSRTARAGDLNHASKFSKTGRNPPSQAVLRQYASHAATAYSYRLQGQRGNGSGLRLRSEISIGARSYTLIERVGERSKSLSFVTMWENV